MDQLGPRLVYGSCPSRLGHMKEEIMELIAKQGNACLHPFNALPYEYYEGGVMGRERTISICCKLIDMCDEFAIFGVSEGTLIELEYYLELNRRLERPQALQVHIREFDPEWYRHYNLFLPRFGMGLVALWPFLFGS